jgi:hypothetical protein
MLSANLYLDICGLFYFIFFGGVGVEMSIFVGLEMTNNLFGTVTQSFVNFKYVNFHLSFLCAFLILLKINI